MRRSKRLTIIRIGLAVATLAMTLPVAAQAKPLPRDPIQAEYQGPGGGAVRGRSRRTSLRRIPSERKRSTRPRAVR